MFSGGPVEPDALIALARVGRRSAGRPTTRTSRRTSLRWRAASRPPTWRPTRRSSSVSITRPARVPRLRRLGVRPARGRDRVRVVDRARLRDRPTCSRPTPTSCGAASCAASRGRSGWLGERARRPRLELTESARLGQRRGASAPNFSVAWRRPAATTAARRRRPTACGRGPAGGGGTPGCASRRPRRRRDRRRTARGRRAGRRRPGGSPCRASRPARRRGATNARSRSLDG